MVPLPYKLAPRRRLILFEEKVSLNLSIEQSEALHQRVKKKNNISVVLFLLPGDDLLSQDPAVQVPSALESLTSVFGMGTGVASPLLSPDYKRYLLL
jgi:hypothetical protein